MGKLVLKFQNAAIQLLEPLNKSKKNIILIIIFEKYFSTNYIRIKIIYIFAAIIKVQKEKQKISEIII